MASICITPGYTGWPGKCPANIGSAGSIKLVTSITDDAEPVKGLFTRVHNTGFNKGVVPGDTLTIRVKSIEDDDFMGLMSAQVLINNEIISHSILEVYYP